MNSNPYPTPVSIFNLLVQSYIDLWNTFYNGMSETYRKSVESIIDKYNGGWMMGYVDGYREAVLEFKNNSNSSS